MYIRLLTNLVSDKNVSQEKKGGSKKPPSLSQIKTNSYSIILSILSKFYYEKDLTPSFDMYIGPINSIILYI